MEAVEVEEVVVEVLEEEEGLSLSKLELALSRIGRTVFVHHTYLVDPASSHMLVSKTKPCMSKYKPLHGETANGSLNQLWFLRSFSSYLDNCSNSRANTCTEAPTLHGERALLLDQNQSVVPQGACRQLLVTLDNFSRSHGLAPATYLSNVCPIKFRRLVTCQPC